MLAANGNSFLRVTAEVTDSSGLTTQVTRNLLPHKVPVSFATAPAGGKVALGGRYYVTPVTLDAWEGQQFGIRAPDQTIGGTAYVFSSWSDGGEETHLVTAPADGGSWTARFATP